MALTIGGQLPRMWCNDKAALGRHISSFFARGTVPKGKMTVMGNGYSALCSPRSPH